MRERRDCYLHIVEHVWHLDPLPCPGHLARSGVVHSQGLPRILLQDSAPTLLHQNYCTDLGHGEGEGELGGVAGTTLRGCVR